MIGIKVVWRPSAVHNNGLTNETLLVAGILTGYLDVHQMAPGPQRTFDKGLFDDKMIFWVRPPKGGLLVYPSSGGGRGGPWDEYKSCYCYYSIASHPISHYPFVHPESCSFDDLFGIR